MAVSAHMRVCAVVVSVGLYVLASLHSQSVGVEGPVALPKDTLLADDCQVCVCCFSGSWAVASLALRPCTHASVLRCSLQHGCFRCAGFVFDLYFPPQYPKGPPNVLLRTTGGGSGAKCFAADAVLLILWP
jgi:hypothetical protein